MSVTFSPASFEATPVALVEKHGFPETMLAHKDELGSVNFHNEGAGRVLEVLGFTPDPEEGLVGACEVDDFLGRVMVALAAAPEDEGMPAFDMFPGAPGARMIQAAREPGDLQRRLRQLRDLAESAIDQGVLMIAWA
jgi:hypothetical protein